MKEHKYRIWDVENQEMITGDEKYIDISNGDIISSGFSCHVVLDPKFNILMQFAGKKDHVGVDIFEDDILSTIEPCGDMRVHVVSFVDCCFISHTKDCQKDFYFLTDFDYIVIGNLHENPELLKW